MQVTKTTVGRLKSVGVVSVVVAVAGPGVQGVEEGKDVDGPPTANRKVEGVLLRIIVKVVFYYNFHLKHVLHFVLHHQCVDVCDCNKFNYY